MYFLNKQMSFFFVHMKMGNLYDNPGATESLAAH